MKIYEKLMNIQSELKAPKGQFNSFGKYNYRSCEDILEAVKPLLAKNKSILTVTDEVVQIGERYYIKAIAKLTDTEDGTSIEVNALAREDETKKGMDLSQVTGSTSSYARKYALNGLFCIDDNKDSDGTNTGEDKPKNNDSKLDKDKVDAIRDLAKVKNVSEEYICKVKKVSKFEELTIKDWTDAMEWLKKR